MFIVDSGTVEIVSPTGAQVYRTLGAGDFFGEIALLTKARRTASCKAGTFCELWVLARKDLQAASHARCAHVTRARAHVVRTLHARYIHVVTRTPHARYAHVMRTLHARYMHVTRT